MTRCRGTYPVSISSHYFYSGAFYRNGRSAEPPSIYRHDGLFFSLSLFLSLSLPLSSSSRSLILQIHPRPTHCTYATLVRALPMLLPLSLFPFFWPFLLVRSLAAVPPRIYTLFSAGNCLSLGTARGSTYERSRDRRNGECRAWQRVGGGDRLCPGSAFNKDR